ncbi:MAG: hypothetical protein AB8G77_24895 [Rhodothermales bacterium]
MGSRKISDTNADEARTALQAVLDRQDTVIMLVIGAGHEKVFERANKSASQNPNTRWAVWIQNPDFLTAAQRAGFTNQDEQTVVCVLAKSDKRPIIHLRGPATRQLILERAFLRGLLQ